jgi:hypothetical protein
MSVLNKNEAMRLFFEVVVVALVWFLGGWIIRGRAHSLHQILMDTAPFVLGATTVTIWRFFRERARSRSGQEQER